MTSQEADRLNAIERLVVELALTLADNTETSGRHKIAIDRLLTDLQYAGIEPTPKP